MFLTVKLLLGRRCSLRVTGQESVAALKKLVSKRLQVPEEQQHLLFRGQLLADDKYLSDYSIGPHASINVIVRPLEKPVSTQACQPQPLWCHLDAILTQHFEPEDAKAVLQLVRQEHEERLQKVSLEDLEQLVSYLLAQEEPPAETEPQATTSELLGKAEEKVEEKEVEEKELEEKEVEEKEVEEKEVEKEVEEEEEEEEEVQEEEEVVEEEEEDDAAE